MHVENIQYPTLLSILWPKQHSRNNAIRSTLLVVIGSCFLWLCAKIQVPFYPVPITMGTFAVLLIGISYGFRLATATLLLYLAEGAIGLPVFAGTPEKGVGLVYMMGSSGGYLIGYVFAAAACGWLAERGWDRRFITILVAMLIANIIIYVPGIYWLGTIHGWHEPILAWGLTPFILGDTIKLLLASTVILKLWHFIGKWKNT